MDEISAKTDKLYNPIVIMGGINVDTMTNNNKKQSLTEALEGYSIKRLELLCHFKQNHTSQLDLH